MNSLKHSPDATPNQGARSLIRNLLLTTGLLGLACESGETRPTNRVDIPETTIPTVKEAQDAAEAQGRVPRKRRSRKNRGHKKEAILADLPKPPMDSEHHATNKGKKKKKSEFDDLPDPGSINDETDK